MLRIVLDNLNTHSEKSLYETFDEKEAERVLQKIEWKFTKQDADEKLSKYYVT
ncbi:MAG: hypothetical protein N2V75_01690 [Methanophagales archaeon]|nr:hypothetical protein [Methanophagales archaeon]